jgi:hypothetical protein
MNADGSFQGDQTSGSTANWLEPAWNPDGAPGSGSSTQLVHASDKDGPPGSYELYIRFGPNLRLTNNSFDDRSPDWQPLTNNYARPKAATPIRIALLPAYKQCNSLGPTNFPNTRHLGAKTTPSCAPPIPESNYLTVGTPDFNGQVANSVNYVEMKAFCNGGAPGENPPCSTTAGDQLDGQITVSLTDVRCSGTSGSCPNGPLSDYVGNLLFSSVARVTDKYSGGNGAATLLDFGVNFQIPCTTTGSASVGSTCSTTTTLDSFLGGPSVITEGKRGVWNFETLRIYDGGSDGVAQTFGDNTVFMVSGLFFP